MNTLFTPLFHLIVSLLFFVFSQTVPRVKRRNRRTKETCLHFQCPSCAEVLTDGTVSDKGVDGDGERLLERRAMLHILNHFLLRMCQCGKLVHGEDMIRRHRCLHLFHNGLCPAVSSCSVNRWCWTSAMLWCVDWRMSKRKWTLICT